MITSILLMLAGYAIPGPYIGLPAPAREGMPQSGNEELQGDDEGPVTLVRVLTSRAEEDAAHQSLTAMGIEPKPLVLSAERKEYMTKAVDVATKYVGVSRANDPKQVMRFLNIFAEKYPPNTFNIKTAFCAAGASYATCGSVCQIQTPAIPFTDRTAPTVFPQILPTVAKYFFYPHPLCQRIIDDAKARGTWVSVNSLVGTNRSQQIKKGYLVFFHFPRTVNGKRVIGNHVGLVSSISDTGAKPLHTVEFNTGQGVVAVKDRQLAVVYGFVRTY